MMHGHIDAFVQQDNGLGLKVQPRPLNELYYDPDDGIPPKLPPKPIYTTTVTHSNTHRPQPHKRKDRFSTASKVPSMAKGKASIRGTGMSYSLSSALSEDLLRQLLQQEAEAKESHRLLRIALEKVETLQRRAVTAEEARMNETARGMRIAQTALGVQEQVEKARQDAEVYRRKLEHMQREIQNQQHLMRTVESERDHAEKSAAKARDVARQLKDERLIAQARQEGRKAGFAEGIRQGRQLAIRDRRREHLPGTPLTAFIEEVGGTPRSGLIAHEELERREKEAAAAAAEEARRAQEAARREQEAAEVARKEREAARREHEAVEIARREQEAIEEVRRQLEAAEAARKELEEAKRQAEEQLRREAEERERQREAEALKAEQQREAERQLELQRIREREAELEQQKKLLADQERTRALELEVLRLREQERERQLEAERERERLLEQERNEERKRREEREAELARERDKVRDLEHEREMSSVSSVSQRGSQAPAQAPRRLEYLAMPEPPAARGTSNAGHTPASAASPLPLRIPPPTLRPPQQFQPHPNPRARPQRRRTSQSSQDTSHSGSTSIRNLDIVTFPSGAMDRRTHLSDIPEVSSHSGASDAGRSPIPTDTPAEPNLRHEMADIEQWRRSTSGSDPDTPTEPASPHSPHRPMISGSHPYGANSVHGSVSSGTIGIEVEPPSGPGSPRHADPEQNTAFLSPMSRPAELAPEPQQQPRQRRPEPPAEPPGGPVIPDMLDSDGDGLGHLMNFGPGFGTPAGFVPMAIRTTSEASSSSERGSLSERERRSTGNRIYGPPASSLGGRPANHGQTPRMQIYGPSAGTQTPRTSVQIYGLPAGSQAPKPPAQIYGPPAGAQTPRQHPIQIYGPPAGSQTPRQPATQIYGPPSGSQTPRQPTTQIYAPAAPSNSGSGTRIYAAPNQTPRTSTTNIYGAPASASAGQRTPIYAPTTPASGPVIPGGTTPRQHTSIYGPPVSPRTAPVIPPSPQPQSQIYNMNATGPVIPSSSPNAYPYPIGTATPSSRSMGLPGGATSGTRNAALPGAGLGMRTPGGSYPASLPAFGSMTPGSRMSALPVQMRGSATPRVMPMTLDEEDADAMEADLQTRMNTQANASGRGGTTMPIPPM